MSTKPHVYGWYPDFGRTSPVMLRILEVTDDWVRVEEWRQDPPLPATYNRVPRSAWPFPDSEEGQVVTVPLRLDLATPTARVYFHWNDRRYFSIHATSALGAEE